MWFKHGVFRKAQICLKMSETEGSTLPCCKPRTDRMFGGNAICSLPRGLRFLSTATHFVLFDVSGLIDSSCFHRRAGFFWGGGGECATEPLLKCIRTSFLKAADRLSRGYYTHAHTQPKLQRQCCSKMGGQFRVCTTLLVKTLGECKRNFCLTSGASVPGTEAAKGTFT